MTPSSLTAHLTAPLATFALLLCVGCASQPADPKEPAPAAASAPAPAASTQPSQGDEPAARTASVFVILQVPDFDAYLKQFKGNAEARRSAGVSRVILGRVLGDAERVAVHFSAGSLESIQSFLSSSEYERLLDEDRATDSALIWIATDELDELPAEVPAGSVSLFKKFPLPDGDCAVQALIKEQGALRSQGVLGYSLHRTTVKSDVAILHLLATDVAAGERAYGGEPLSSALKACGASELDHPVLAENQTEL